MGLLKGGDMRPFPIEESSVTNLGDIGLPTYRGHQIWSLTEGFDGIQFSDDWGDTWKRWTTFDQSPRPRNSDVLLLDTQGNCYYSDGSGLLRVDAKTKKITVALTWYPQLYLRDDPKHDEDKAFEWNFYNWGWGLSQDGSIYVAAYTLTPPIHTPSGKGGHYVWKGDPGGLHFERFDVLVSTFPNDRHVHSIHENPYTGNVYVVWGDNENESRKIGVSNKDMLPVNVIPGRQMTGLTFTSEATYFSTDKPGVENGIYRTVDGSTLELVMLSQCPFAKTPIYSLRAAGDDELWCTAVNDAPEENPDPNMRSGVLLLKRVNNTWRWRTILDASDPSIDRRNYYSIAHDGVGTIPKDAPFVYVRVVPWTKMPDPNIESSTLRIRRLPQGKQHK
jgi:hypothetical protein